MNGPSLKRLFFTIEVNLLLWIAAAIAAKGAPVVLVGLVLAAVLQHWAYYDLYRHADQGPGGRRHGG